MNVLFYGLLLAALAFLLHLVIWKIYLPKRQVAALLKIFFLVLISGIFLLIKFPKLINWDILPSANFFEISQLLLLYISITAAYIVSYPAIEADSPTLVIIKAVAGAGVRGLDKSKLEEMMKDDLLIVPRVRDMLSDKMIYLDGEKYKLMPKGMAMARIFLFYKNMIRGAKGG